MLAKIDINNKTTTFEYKHPMLKDTVVKVIEPIYVPEEVMKTERLLRELIEDTSRHNIKQYVTSHNYYGEYVCEAFYQPVINDFVDRVRQRPAAMFGGIDKKAAINSIKSIVSELLPVSDNIEISVDGDVINVRAEDVNIYKRYNWEIVARKGQQDIIEIFKACTDELEVQVHHRGAVQRQFYTKGKHVKTVEVRPDRFSRDAISLSFTISHDVFNYDNINSEDLNFIKIN